MVKRLNYSDFSNFKDPELSRDDLDVLRRFGVKTQAEIEEENRGKSNKGS